MVAQIIPNLTKSRSLSALNKILRQSKLPSSKRARKKKTFKSNNAENKSLGTRLGERTGNAANKINELEANAKQQFNDFKSGYNNVRGIDNANTVEQQTKEPNHIIEGVKNKSKSIGRNLAISTGLLGAGGAAGAGAYSIYNSMNDDYSTVIDDIIKKQEMGIPLTINEQRLLKLLEEY